MDVHRLLCIHFIPLILLIMPPHHAFGYGSIGSIAATFGEESFYCAIDASGKQDVICWSNNASYVPPMSSSLPPMASLSGGEGFMCGILANTSQAFCWNSGGENLVPVGHQKNTYSQIAAGKNHVCAIRGFYYAYNNSGSVDCWEFDSILLNSSFRHLHEQYMSNRVFEKVVAGDGFTCGVTEGGIICWGPNSPNLGISSEDLINLASAGTNLCGISRHSSEVKCWGEPSSSSSSSMGVQFVSLAAGRLHYCGIRRDDHGIECWGRFNSSLLPKASSFIAIAASDFTTCGIREDDLVLDCWHASRSDMTEFEFDPPLELCSPGLCSSAECGEGEFAFNVSFLNEPDLTSICLRKELQICSPCASNCSHGFFPSTHCTATSDRACTPCSLCQNSSCWDVCGSPSSNPKFHKSLFEKLMIIIASGSLFLVLLFFMYRVKTLKPEEEDEAKEEGEYPLTAQIFRLSELKDATSGFKEFNELGRGRFGFVYKSLLADGRQVVVKRANAATIIRSNIRDFEAELEIRCKIRHCNIVNLLGYSLEMGERLLVYQYMPHGTLHDHLHSGLSSLSWNRRLKISMEAAKGLAYLHNEAVPGIVHGDVRSSNIFLDSSWVARVSDLGFHTSWQKEMKDDVYCFGIVLFEVLSGRKGYDAEFTPPAIVDWAAPLVREGKASAIVDRSVALPRNVEPLLKLAGIAELAARRNVDERPVMSVIVDWLEQIVKDGMIF